MNREDIIPSRTDVLSMAREAGFNVEQGFLLRVTGIDEDLERFAALVAAAAQAKEREACAKVVDANANQCGTAVRLILESNAAAIRARSNA